MKSFKPFFILFFPIFLFYLPVFFQQKIPLPADTIPGLYHPMRDAVSDQYPNGPPYKNYLITDSVRQQYPWRKFAVDQLKKGQIPWWNPYNFSGTPHLANFQSAVFYPLNLIFWLVPFRFGWTVLVLSQSFLGALFMYLYLKNLKLNDLSSWFGAWVWIFSGFFIAWLEWNTAVHVALWSPLILLLIDKLTTKPKKWHYPILVFSLVSQTLAGYPQPWVYLSLLQFCYLLFRVIHNLNAVSKNTFNPHFRLLRNLVISIEATKKSLIQNLRTGDVDQSKNSLTKSTIKPLIPLAITFFVSFLIVSPQLLATYRFSKLSNRTADQGNLLQKPDWFLPVQNLTQLIIPDFFGNPATLNYWGVFNYTEFVTYIGVIPFFFVLYALFSKKRTKNTLFFLIFSLTALLLATKNPISLFQFSLNIPFIGSSQPSRWVVVFDLCLAVLSAHGVHRFQQQKKLSFRPFTVLLLIFFIIWGIVIFGQDRFVTAKKTDWLITQRNLTLPTIELGFIVFAFFFLYLSKQKPFKKISLPQKEIRLIVLSFLIFVSTLSGLRFARKFTPFSDSEFLYPQTKILTYLQKNTGHYRYMTTDRRLMAPNINLAYRLYSIEGYDPLYLKDYAALVYSSETGQIEPRPKPYNRIVTTDNFNSPIINLLGVKYILSLSPLESNDLEFITTEGETYLYQNSNAFPRAFTTQKNDPQNLSLDQITPAQIVSYTPNLVKIKVNLKEPSKLILTDAYYRDWQANLDGNQTPIENWYGLKAIIVPKGTHEITFFYRYPQL